MSKSASVSPEIEINKEMVTIELTKPFHMTPDIEIDSDSPDNDFQPIKIASSNINDSIIEIPVASINRISINERSLKPFRYPVNKDKIIYSKNSAFTKTTKGGKKSKKSKKSKKIKRKTTKRK